MTKQLSPAAQEVLTAAICDGPELEYRIAATLRAAAKPFHWTWNAEMCHKHLVAIADELEKLND